MSKLLSEMSVVELLEVIRYYAGSSDVNDFAAEIVAAVDLILEKLQS
jgi:hypothetical protein